MATPTLNPRRSRTGTSDRPVSARLPVTSNVRLPWVALGVLLIFGGALTGGVLMSNVADRQAVLVMARSVQAGAVIQQADLNVVRISKEPGLNTIGASERLQIVGRVASTDLPAGTLLVRAHLANGSRLAAGQAEVGLALKPGQFPTHLGPGDHVMVVRISSPGSNDDDAVVLVHSAVVVAVEPTQEALGTVVITIRLSAADAPLVAALGSAGRASLVLVSGKQP